MGRECLLAHSRLASDRNGCPDELFIRWPMTTHACNMVMHGTNLHTEGGPQPCVLAGKARAGVTPARAVHMQAHMGMRQAFACAVRSVQKRTPRSVLLLQGLCWPRLHPKCFRLLSHLRASVRRLPLGLRWLLCPRVHLRQTQTQTPDWFPSLMQPVGTDRRVPSLIHMGNGAGSGNKEGSGGCT